MDKCPLCHSFAVNPHLGDRKDSKIHKDLCDVCFWKVQVEELAQAHRTLLRKYTKIRKRLSIAMKLGNLTIKDITDVKA